MKKHKIDKKMKNFFVKKMNNTKSISWKVHLKRSQK